MTGLILGNFAIPAETYPESSDDFWAAERLDRDDEWLILFQRPILTEEWIFACCSILGEMETDRIDWLKY